MRLISAVATAIVSLIVSLAACETIVRIWDGIPLWPPRDMVSYKSSFLNTNVAAEYDPLLGWRHKPHFFAQPGWDLTTGDLGIRMNSAAITPLPAHGILAVGDSFTAGSEVADDKTFPAQLERLLKYPVINAAVGGYGTDQMILMAETLMPRLSPTAIVVGILDDDINRTGMRVYGGAPKPWFQVRDGRLIHHYNPVPAPTLGEDKPMLRWLAYSYLSLWATERLGWAHVWERQAFINADNDPIAVSCAMLERLKQATDARGIPLYVVMLYAGSDRIAVMDPAVEKARPLAVSACSRRMGLATIDLLDDLVAFARHDPATYRGLYTRLGPNKDVYGHMTAAGNAFVARAIAARMTDDGFADRLRRARDVSDAAAHR
jgi:lysophospholipase L1-like esterase